MSDHVKSQKPRTSPEITVTVLHVAESRRHRVSFLQFKMAEITKRKKGQVLNNSERQLILNLMNYIKSKNSDKSVSEIVREISQATGCSERTIYKIKKEASKGLTAIPHKTRSRKKENKNSRNVKYDSFVKSLIRKKIHSYFLQNCSPTLNTILCIVNSNPDLPNFKRSTLHTLLKEIGFVYVQKGKKSLLSENRDLVKLRQAYIKHLRQFRNENKWIIYTGETVISLVSKEVKKNKIFKRAVGITEREKSEQFQSGCATINTVLVNALEATAEPTVMYTVDTTALENVVMAENLQPGEGISLIQGISYNSGNIPIHRIITEEDKGMKKDENPLEEDISSVGQSKESGRELRLAVMHAGSDHGFLQGVDFITFSKRKAEDNEIYKNWLLEKLLPKVPPNSVVVTDINTPCYKADKIFPDASWKKHQIRDWLLSKDIKVEHLSQKKDFLAMVNQVRPLYSTNYKIEEKAKERGITILTLPPFHYELNPLNLVWAQVKCYVRANIQSFKVKKIKHLIRESFHSVSQFNWMNYMHHIREVEGLLWKTDEHEEVV